MIKDLYLGARLRFDTPDSRRESERILVDLMGLVCRLNYLYLLQNPDTKPLYDSGVVYAPPDQVARPPIDKQKLIQIFKILQSMGLEPDVGIMVGRLVRGPEIFLDIPWLYSRGKGDCNELVPVRVAELWRAGIKASPKLVWPEPNSRGGLTYHVIVEWPDGSGEDPSLLLGMGGDARSPDRTEEIRKNKERWDAYMAAARVLVQAEGVPPVMAAKQVDLMGLLPKSGVFAC